MPYIRLLEEGELPVALLAGGTIPSPDSGTGAVGTSDYAARADHSHPEITALPEDVLGVSIPQAPASSGSPGMSVKAAREDHVHPEQVIPEVPTIPEETIAASTKTSPVTADILPLIDTQSSNALKQVTLSNILTLFNVRKRLSSHLTLYVRTDGNDSNNGLTNTSGGAFRTIQQAINIVLADYDLAGWNITIQVGAGAYEPVYFGNPQTGSGSIILQGDVTNPDNVTIQSNLNHCINVDNGARLTVKGFKLWNSSGNALLFAGINACVFVTGNMNFAGGGTGNQIYSVFNGVVYLATNYSLTGGGATHYAADRGGLIIGGGFTVTISGGTLNFSNTFAFSIDGGVINNYSCWFNVLGGSAVTGARHWSTHGGVIDTFTGGANPNYFPGSSAGGTYNGGVFN